MTGNGGEQRTLRILLVEDNPIDARALQRACAGLALATEVEHFADGAAALHRVREPGLAHPPPDLLLLDLNLPGFDGFDLLRMIKSDGVLRHIPIVVLSTSSIRKDVIAAYDLGANAYVAKPTGLDGWNKVVEGIAQFWFRLAILPGDA